MSEARFTPGPWKAKLDHQYYWSVYSDSDVFFRIASASDTLPDRGEANARLIAAAPELLAALRLAKDHSELEDEVLDIVNDAIAKASPSTPDMEEVSHG